MRRIEFGLLLSTAVLVMAVACSSNPESTASGTSAGSAANPGRGKELYKANCVACHGETGKGDGPGAGVLKPKPRDHTDAAYMSKLSDQEIGDIIRMGGAPKNMPQMPSHPQINGPDLAALVAYVRSLSQHKTGN
jgi:mono/diheme cytochrome c family protein